MRTLRAIVLLALAMAAAAAQAQDPREAEQRLQKVRSELKAVASERRKLGGARGDATRQLRQADEQVGSVQRNLRGIEATLQRDSETLAQLQAERATHAGDLDASKAELARLLRAAQAGRPAVELARRPEHGLQQIGGGRQRIAHRRIEPLEGIGGTP